MPADVKRDLYGSSETRSTESLQSRATRLCRVRDVDGTIAGMKEAIDAAADGQSFHPNFEQEGMLRLPIAAGRAIQTGATQYDVALHYRRRRAIFALRNHNSQHIGRGRYAGKEYVQWYRTSGADNDAFDGNGLPNGPINGIDRADNKDATPRPYELPLNTWRFLIPFVVTTLAGVDSLMGTMNNGTVTLGGKTFATGTLLFNAPAFDWFTDETGSYFVGWYDFTYFPAGFVQEICWFNEEGSEHYDNTLTQNEWVTRQQFLKPLANFATFPGAT